MQTHAIVALVRLLIIVGVVFQSFQRPWPRNVMVELLVPWLHVRPGECFGGAWTSTSNRLSHRECSAQKLGNMTELVEPAAKNPGRLVCYSQEEQSSPSGRNPDAGGRGIPARG